MKIERKRVDLWDNLKFILILLVVIGHFADFLVTKSINMRRTYFYIYLFHMPLFIFIGGLFSKKTIDNKDYKKIVEYLTLYLIIIMIQAIFTLISGGMPNFKIFTTAGVQWYMLALFNFNLILMLLDRVDKKYLFIFSIILACFAGYDANIGDFLCLSRTIVFFPFFLAGYLLDQKKVIEFCKKRKVQILAIIFLIGTLLLCYFFIKDIYFLRQLITGRNPFIELSKYKRYGIIFRFLYYIVATLFIISLISLTPKNRIAITTWGRRSLSIYVWHYPIINLFFSKLNGYKLLKQTNTYLTIFPLALLLTIVLAQEVFEKPINYLKQIRYEKK